MKKNSKKKINKNNLGQYRKCFNYIKESKKYIYTAITIFSLFIIIGFIFPVFFKEKIFTLVKDLTEKTSGMNAFELIRFIFFNNLKSAFLALILGVGFCIVPFIDAVANGYLIGFVARYSVDKSGALVLWRLLPHGIFELPAIIISIGLGLKLGTLLFRKGNFKRELVESLRVFIFVILLLLVFAAIIEGILVFYLQ